MNGSALMLMALSGSLIMRSAFCDGITLDIFGNANMDDTINADDAVSFKE